MESNCKVYFVLPFSIWKINNAELKNIYILSCEHRHLSTKNGVIFSSQTKLSVKALHRLSSVPANISIPTVLIESISSPLHFHKFFSLTLVLSLSLSHSPSFVFCHSQSFILFLFFYFIISLSLSQIISQSFSISQYLSSSSSSPIV